MLPSRTGSGPFAAFLRQPDPLQAALCALWLCIDYRKQIGNTAASAGWVARLARLVFEFELEPLRGWLLVVKAFDTDDPVAGEDWARQAHELARASEDLDLEFCAASEVGLMLVRQGRVAEGVPWLDESMAGSLGGEGASPDTVVWTSCNMITCCTQCAEFERAVQWVRAADAFTRRYGCPYLFTECRTLYGAVLVALGDWGRAEEELRTAIELSRAPSRCSTARRWPAWPSCAWRRVVSRRPSGWSWAWTITRRSRRCWPGSTCCAVRLPLRRPRSAGGWR